jgi:hypothetical protein
MVEIITIVILMEGKLFFSSPYQRIENDIIGNNQKTNSHIQNKNFETLTHEIWLYQNSYYYQNTNGSTYYSSPSGAGTYTAPSGNQSSSSQSGKR